MKTLETSIEHRLSIQELTSYRTKLLRAFVESGVGSAKIDECISSLRARCLVCGIGIDGSELARVALGDNQTDLGIPKLDRLRLGYCARDGCSSNFYALLLDQNAGIDWTNLLARADQCEQQSVESEEAIAPKRPPLLEWSVECWRQLGTRDRRAVVILAGLLFILIAIPMARRGVRIPFVSPKARSFVVESGQANGRPATGPPVQLQKKP